MFKTIPRALYCTQTFAITGWLNSVAPVKDCFLSLPNSQRGNSEGLIQLDTAKTANPAFAGWLHAGASVAGWLLLKGAVLLLHIAGHFITFNPPHQR